MLAVAFETLKLARKLESAGFSPKQSQEASAAISESFSEWQAAINLATKKDLARLETTVATKEDSPRIEANSMRIEANLVKMATKEDVTKLEIRLAEIKVETIRWVIGVGFAQIAMVLMAIKFHS